ncbi:MAG TPA: SDR family oxidoreductase [Polyangiaceae bacterium]|nr:SDR family oxidoreductase [Polyangiaceae bacterium]
MPKSVVISGGTRGLGKALSLEFGRAGYSVTALYRSDSVAAAELTRQWEAQGMSGRCLRWDLGEPPPRVDVLAGSSTTVVLVNNAWPQFEPKPSHLCTWEDYENGCSSGLKGAVALTRTLLPRMLAAKSGTVINVLTAGLLGPSPKGFAPYLSAKQALVGFGSAVAAEYRALGVRVFGVCPPFMDTPRTREWNGRIREAIETASGGATEPAVVAASIVSLAQNASIAGAGELHAVP